MCMYIRKVYMNVSDPYCILHSRGITNFPNVLQIEILSIAGPVLLFSFSLYQIKLVQSY